jgi:hypothetical protein
VSHRSLGAAAFRLALYRRVTIGPRRTPSPQRFDPCHDLRGACSAAIAAVCVPLFEQAQAAEETGNIAEAERLYRLLMKRDPTDAAAPFNLGNMLRSNGRRVEAEAALRAGTR